MVNLSKKALISFFIWVACLLFFSLIVFVNYFSQILSKNNIALFVFFVPILIGVISFLVFLIISVKFLFKKQNLEKKHSFIKFLRVFLIILSFPICIAKEILIPIQIFKKIKNRDLKSLKEKNVLANLGITAILILFLTPIWGGVYFLAVYVPANMAGLISSPMPIVGTGSMYPTFPKSDKKDDLEKYKEVVASANFVPYPNGINISGLKLLNHNLERGDIITFKNSTTRNITKKQFGVETGFMKRLIALPDDTLELREGIVYLNGKKLKEPYTAKPQSTFAEEFLSECKKIKVPPNKIFAMGDNRKGSGDSREIGFVDIKDVDHVLSIEDQRGKWDKKWRNTDKDFDTSSKIKLDREKYLDVLNAKRKEAGVRPLKYQPKLEKSASLRGEVILKYDDFSWEATKSGYTMYNAMLDANYSNITYGEAPTQGYFEADELIDNQFQFPKSKDFLLNKDYEEIGIGEVEGTINGCPTQVIVQHFAGYVPPNYKESDIQSWGALINDLNNVIPGWEKIKGYPNINQDDLDKLIGLMYQRKNQAEAVYYKMKANQWLTEQEKSYIDQDKSLYDQINVLANKLNGK